MGLASVVGTRSNILLFKSLNHNAERRFLWFQQVPEDETGENKRDELKEVDTASEHRISKRCSNPVKNWTAKKTYICCECTAEPFSMDTKLKRVTIIKCIPEKQTLQAYKGLQYIYIIPNLRPTYPPHIGIHHFINSPKWELLRHPVTPDIPRHSSGLISPQSKWCIARYCPVESTWWLSWLVNDIFH